MELIKSAVQWVLDLGAVAMLPILLTIFGLILGQGFVKSLRAGITVGIGFVGINLVIGLLTGGVGAAGQAMVQRLGVNLGILDVGWPVGAAITWATPIAMILIPSIFLLNILLLAVNFTKTMDVDLWNYWHLIFPGAMVFYFTRGVYGDGTALVIAVICALINTLVIFKLADWTAPAVEHEFGLPGISLPHGETVNWAPVTYALNKVYDAIPGFNKINLTAGNLKDKIGFAGEPMVIGLVLGAILGVLAGYDAKAVINIAIQMGAVMVLLPRMVSLLMEGLMPISEGAREFIQKRFPGKDVYIGLDAAICTGHPTVITVAILAIPITIVLAVILPYNQLLPLADLAVLPFTVIWAVASSRGNLLRAILNTIVILCVIFFFATNLGQLTTTMGHEVGFAFPEGATQISGIDMSAHITVWIILKLLDFRNFPAFISGVAGLVVYTLLWIWVRNDIKKTYASQSDKA
ncbi:MAG: PTS galactitol transporter subunit IIC [Treponema sp.]|jgi:PTS system galactitol-specific IIC component|nr:PTS galactitol transporter subunit IIC [Treponema sp.]